MEHKKKRELYGSSVVKLSISLRGNSLSIQETGVLVQGEVSMDSLWQDNVEGVRHRHIADFLLDDA